MGRAPCCEKEGLKRGPWTSEEDVKLINYINEYGHGSWRALPKKAGLLRCGKSCRLRWTNYLRPDIKRGEFSASEEQTIIQLHGLLGNRWSAIASHLPKRTDNEIKNYWNTYLKKRLAKVGIDPATHKPKTKLLGLSENCTSGEVANGNSSLSHVSQWESARLEAEARLARESKLRTQGLWATPVTAISACSTQLQSISTNQQHCLPTLQEAWRVTGSVEHLPSFHNWKKSLQGQADVMWPDAWNCINTMYGLHTKPLVQQSLHELSSTTSHSSLRLTAIATATATTTSSSCTATTSSSKLGHGSPTSTLCSTHQSFSHSHDVRKLSWNDSLRSPSLDVLLPPYVQHTSYGEAISDDEVSVLRGGSHDSNEFDRKLDSLGLPCLQNMIFESEQAWLLQMPPEPSMFLTGPESNPEIKAEKLPQINAEDEHHLNIEALGRQKCSHSTYEDDECDDAMRDLPIMVYGGSSSVARPVSFAALITEDIPNYWKGMLEDDVTMSLPYGHSSKKVPFAHSS